MVLLKIKSLKDFKEYEVIPLNELNNQIFYDAGIFSHSEIIRIVDREKNNLTAFDRWRLKLPLCPKCNHRSRAIRILDRDAILCRWGHITTGLEMCSVNSNKGRV